MHFSAPNLPQGKVKLVIIGDKYASLLPPLKCLGVEALLLYNNPNLPAPCSSHADMSLLHVDKGIVVAAPAVFESLRPLVHIGFTIIRSELDPGSTYPSDSILNAVIMRDVLLYKELDRCVEKHCPEHLNRIKVQQGYVKCSTCIVDDRSFITADNGIATTLKRVGFEVLLIQPGHIRLDGYDTGFIGGTCGKLSRDIIAFTGRLDAHPDYKRIMDFMLKRGVHPVFLTDEPVFDIGSIIPLLES